MTKREISKRTQKHVKYLEDKMRLKFRIESIEYLSELPNGINYITWSIGDLEVHKSFKIIAKNKIDQQIEVYAQTKSLFGWLFRAMYWQKVNGKFKRIIIKRSYE